MYTYLHLNTDSENPCYFCKRKTAALWLSYGFYCNDVNEKFEGQTISFYGDCKAAKHIRIEN